MNYKSLTRKAVINTYNGLFLGYITDVILSFPSGNIEYIIVKLPLFKRILSSFMHSGKFKIHFNNLISIGKDVILVNIIDK